jgi:hypothetical protein
VATWGRSDDARGEGFGFKWTAKEWSSKRLDRAGPCLEALMQTPLQAARAAYLRLASSVGPIPLTLLVSLIAVTALAWAFTLYQPFAMSASMDSGMGEMQGMAMEDMAMNSMAAGWSFAGLLAS